MFFIDNPVHFRVPNDGEDHQKTVFRDVSRVIHYRLNEGEKPPAFNEVKFVFGPGLVWLDVDLWTFQDIDKTNVSRRVILTFQGAKFTERLNQLREKLAGLNKDDRKSREQVEQAFDTIAKLFIAFCDETPIEIYIPYAGKDGKSRNAVLNLQLSHGPIEPITAP